jgi:hypothetical protein
MDSLTRKQIVATAEQIVTEDIGLVDGCRRLLRLFNSLDRKEWDSDLFDPISTFESETEDLPVGELRSMWNPQALAAKEARAKPYLDHAKDWVYEACRGLINKYGDDARA